MTIEEAADAIQGLSLAHEDGKQQLPKILREFAEGVRREERERWAQFIERVPITQQQAAVCDALAELIRKSPTKEESRGDV